MPDRTLPITTGCTFAPLRRRSRLRDTLGPSDCSVLLYSCGEAFGYSSLAQGDWDGFPDIDLLVVAANQDAAERAADQLMEALVGDDLLAIDQERWQAMARSPRPTGGTTPSSLLSCSRCQSTRGLTMTRLAQVAARR